MDEPAAAVERFVISRGIECGKIQKNDGALEIERGTGI
jgi:hypothetical protein